jgi:predicted Fe-Mo cluster-binding NifX family protein
MKIAIVSDDQKTIASHFGRALGFVIFESENGSITGREYRPNRFTMHVLNPGEEGYGPEHHHSHGPIIEALRDCSVVISHGMGRRIYDDLRSTGKEVYITSEIDVEAAVKLYLKGDLIDRPEMRCDHSRHNE